MNAAPPVGRRVYLLIGLLAGLAYVIAIHQFCMAACSLTKTLLFQNKKAIFDLQILLEYEWIILHFREANSSRRTDGPKHTDMHINTPSARNKRVLFIFSSSQTAQQGLTAHCQETNQHDTRTHTQTHTHAGNRKINVSVFSPEKLCFFQRKVFVGASVYALSGSVDRDINAHLLIKKKNERGVTDSCHPLISSEHDR